MKNIFKYGIVAFFVVAVAIAGIAIDNAISSKAEIVKQPIDVKTDVDMTQAAVDKAAADNEDISTAVVVKGAAAYEKEALDEVRRSLHDNCNYWMDSDNLDAVIKLNDQMELLKK
jgi:hypothetical protein